MNEISARFLGKKEMNKNMAFNQNHPLSNYFKTIPLFRNYFFSWGSLSNDDGEGYKKVTDKVKPDFIALIPSRSIRQMLAIFSGVEF